MGQLYSRSQTLHELVASTNERLRANGQGLAAALRASANATHFGAGRDSKTQKRPDLARAQRGQLQPIVSPQRFSFIAFKGANCYLVRGYDSGFLPSGSFNGSRDVRGLIIL